MRFISTCLSVLSLMLGALRAAPPPLPRLIKHNLHPFMKRGYGKVLAGGGGCMSSLRVRAFATVALVLAVAGAAFFIGASLFPTDGPYALAILGASSQSLRQGKAQIVAKARTIMETAKREGRELTETEERQIDEIQVEASELDPKIARAERQENLEAELGRSQGTLAGRQDTDPGRTGTEPSATDPYANLSTEQRGLLVARIVRAVAAGKGDVARAAQFAEKSWGEQDLAYRALAASDEVSGGAVIPDPLAAAVIELLRPMSAIRRLNPVTIPMGSGTLRLPKLTGGAQAEYIGENSNAPKTEQTFGQLRLTFRKLAALVPVSNDLLRYATPNVDALVRDDVTSAIGQRSDLAFIRGQGTEHSPKGLRYWAPAANVIPANVTVNLDNVTVDLGKLILALEEANVRMIRPGWLFSPRTKHFLMTVRDGNGNFAFRDEMLQGRLWDVPFAVTSQVPKNLGGGGNESEVYLADFADVVIGEALNLLLDASREAAYHDGSNVQAAFSLDQTVVRALQEHDFGMRHDESVAVLTGVTWGAA